MMGIQNFYATYIEKNIFMVAREKDIAGLVSSIPFFYNAMFCKTYICIYCGKQTINIPERAC